ncbi:hypothetical protein TWF192_009115 [Orbilia oligospora]|uniref:Uncharacterized protein n=1 Tax=Orbilia oligospora TaxID=2813651 RepID=A0A6G1MLC3_ORBOL|nr:hypothetical protein TWF679_001871 [Orbilia oligospora]KAF3220032.1 hypothetical protein TWF191_007603 [Orbilia oligospora]KAF3261183.1 hypothetical protein TWF192_009115 [Orbilia oligospora]
MLKGFSEIMVKRRKLLKMDDADADDAGVDISFVMMAIEDDVEVGKQDFPMILRTSLGHTTT